MGLLNHQRKNSFRQSSKSILQHYSSLNTEVHDIYLEILFKNIFQVIITPYFQSTTTIHFAFKLQSGIAHITFPPISVTFTGYFNVLLIPSSLPSLPPSLIKTVKVVQGYNTSVLFSTAEKYAANLVNVSPRQFVHLSVEDTCLAFVLQIC